MHFQAYHAEGRTNTPAKARLAATMKDCVGSDLVEPGMKNGVELVTTRMTAAPRSRSDAKALNTSWIREGQWSGDLAWWLVD